MGLYDNYRLSNSRQVRQYQGSVVPELVAVSTEMQRRYDQTQDTNDYTSRFLGNLQSLDADKHAVQELRNDYKGKLAAISARPDLENATREATMLAKQLPDDYSPIAENLKRASAYKAEADKNMELYVTSGGEKGVNPNRAAQYVEASMDRYNKSGGIKRDETGRYKPTFSGIDMVGDLDQNKFVDDAMKNVAPQVIGSNIENINGDWMVKNGSETRKLTPSEITRIVDFAADNSEHWKQYLNSEKLLGTYKNDYSKLSKEDFLNNLTPNMRNQAEEAINKGKSLAEVKRVFDYHGIEQEHRNSAKRYAMKYAVNDSKVSRDLSANPYALEDHKEKIKQAALQMATTMTIGGAKVADVADFHDVQKETNSAYTETMTSYSDWTKGIKDGKVKIDLGGGRTGYKDGDGRIVDVTADANNFRNQIKYADEKRQQLSAVESAAKRESGYTGARKEDKVKIDANLKKIAELNKIDLTAAGQGARGIMNAVQDLKKENQKLMEGPGFKQYEKSLQRRMTGTNVGSDLFGFLNEKNVKAVSSQIEAVVSGLGSKNGLIPVQVGSGSDKGKQLSADEWDELKGNMQVIGVTATGDASSPLAMVVRGFKNVKGKKTEGEDMIVRLPNTNIGQIAKSNMNDEQYYYMQKSAGLAQSLNNPSRTFSSGNVKITANTEDPRAGWTVRKGDTEQTLYSFKAIIDFLDKQ